MVATALWCWVSPIAQQNTVASESRSSSAASVICSRLRPVTSVSRSQSSREVITPRLEASVYRATKSASTASPGDQQLPEGLEERQIAIDLDRQVQVGQVGAAADDPARLLRVAEVDPGPPPAAG